VKTTARAAFLAAVVLLARGAMACPSCAASSSPKDPNIWPLVALFMLVPWVLAAVVTILIRRESTSFFGSGRHARAPLAGVLSRARKLRPA
jgi:cytochrome bd-type quinol oxidase subunit 2